MLVTPEVDLVYDIHGPLPAGDGRPPLVMIGQPMDASGFATLASLFPDRTVVTYDPRGVERSTKTEPASESTPDQHADDLHRIIDELGMGP
ncbi:MAG TPA: alpha/beta hydrolase, partial [Streptosporangiaceae bacterium]|nr:alpha/beta hydrolase [Streptosporangiaceae bacterium]